MNGREYPVVVVGFTVRIAKPSKISKRLQRPLKLGDALVDALVA
jgi:hypothetical protein